MFFYGKQKNKLFPVLDIVPVLDGLYSIFVSLTGKMEYINSPDKRIANAERGKSGRRFRPEWNVLKGDRHER